MSNAFRDFLLRFRTAGADRTVSDINRVDSALDGAERSGAEAAQGLERVGRAGTRASQGLGDFSRGADRVRNSARDLRDGVNSAGASASRSSSVFSSFGASLIELQAGFGVAAAGAVALQKGLAALKVPAGFAIDFETGVAKIRTLTDDLSATFEEDLKALAGRLPQTQADLAAAAYQAISAGINPDQVIDFLESSAKTAVAGATSLTNAVDLMTTATNAYKESGLSTAQASDILFETVRKGKTTIDELNSALGTAAPLAAAYKVPLEEIGAATATLTKQGNATAESMTQINALLKAVVKPAPKYQKAFQKIGVEFGAARIEAVGLTGVLEDIQRATEGDADEIGKLFGRIEALKGAVGLMSGDMKGFKSDLDAIANSAGATSRAFNTMADTTKGSMNRIKAASEGVLLDIGTKMLPVINEALSEFEQWWSLNGEDVMKSLNFYLKALWEFGKGTVKVFQTLWDVAMWATGMRAIEIGVTKIAEVLGLVESTAEQAAKNMAWMNAEAAKSDMEDLANAAKDLERTMGRGFVDFTFIPTVTEEELEKKVVEPSKKGARKSGRVAAKSWMDAFLQEVESTNLSDGLADALKIDGRGDLMAQLFPDEQPQDIFGVSAFGDFATAVNEKMDLAREGVKRMAADTAALNAIIEQSTDAMTTGFANAAVGALFFGESFTEGVNKAMSALFRQAAVETLKELALGFGSLAIRDAQGAALHFKSSAIWGGIAALSGLATAATGGTGGGGGGGAPSPAAPPSRGDVRERDTRGDGGPTAVTINFGGTMPLATKDDIGRTVVQVLDEYSRKRGRARAPMTRFER